MNSQRTPGFGTGVLEDERVERDLRTTDDGDHERLSHYVPKDKLMEAMVNAASNPPSGYRCLDLGQSYTCSIEHTSELKSLRLR